nr:IS110 family transposase [Amycolatopsis sacchari]
MTQSGAADIPGQEAGDVVGGVDTHRDTHTAAAVLATTGQLLGVQTFPATGPGYAQLARWLESFGALRIVGVEGTGAYGAGLTRYLTGRQITVVEVDRPDRRTRRARGKSDPIDAEAAARAALTGERISTPKNRDGHLEALRALRIARRSAVTARKIVAQQVHALLVTAPEPLRDQLRGRRLPAIITLCAPAPDTSPGLTDPTVAVRLALHHLAVRYQHLTAEIDQLDTAITGLVNLLNPALLALPGVGPDCAGQLLLTAGDNPDRLRSEAAFAHLCGVAPIPASSGRTDRHRLNRGGDRQANAALYRIALSRLRWDPRTQAYKTRRTHQGLSTQDIIRCLKRYLAREIYNTLHHPTTSTNIP